MRCAPCFQRYSWQLASVSVAAITLWGWMTNRMPAERFRPIPEARAAMPAPTANNRHRRTEACPRQTEARHQLMEEHPRLMAVRLLRTAARERTAVLRAGARRMPIVRAAKFAIKASACATAATPVRPTRRCSAMFRPDSRTIATPSASAHRPSPPTKRTAMRSEAVLNSPRNGETFFYEGFLLGWRHSTFHL